MDDRVRARAREAHRQVDSLYDIIGGIGSGAYGAVNKARLKDFPSHVVAIKSMRAAEGAGIPQDVYREITILHKLRHENIVRLEKVFMQPAGTGINQDNEVDKKEKQQKQQKQERGLSNRLGLQVSSQTSFLDSSINHNINLNSLNNDVNGNHNNDHCNSGSSSSSCRRQGRGRGSAPSLRFRRARSGRDASMPSLRANGGEPGGGEVRGVAAAQGCGLPAQELDHP